MLYCPTPFAVRTRFDELLAEGSDEHALHDFMVWHTEFIPTFVQLNHGVYLSCVFNKLALGPYQTDFVYVTKSSDRVRIVLTEIEPCTKPLFTNKRGGVGISAQLTDALDQVRGWRSALDRTSARSTILEDLRGFLWDADHHEIGVDFRFQLLIGRRPSNPAQLAKLGDLTEETGIEIKTYDSVCDAVDRGDCERLIVMCAREGRFHVQNWDTHPNALHGYAPLHRLWLSKDDEALYQHWGYPVGTWDTRDHAIRMSDMMREQMDYAEWRCANKATSVG